jgi:WD40 repeat protein
MIAISLEDAFPAPRFLPFRRSFLLLALTALTLLPLSAAEPPAQKKIDFEAQVLPILKRNCLACHNATDAKGELVLETPATILKGGESGPAVEPRNGAESFLLQTSARTEKPYMPPKDNKVGAEILKPEELAVIKAWIDQGATGTVSAKAKPVKWSPLPPGLHPILAIAASGDGQFAACGRANQIFIYHIPTGQIVARITDPKLVEKTGRSGYRSAAQRDFVQSLAFSPDGHLLASGEYRMVKLWQREPNLPQFTLGQDTASALAASADGKWLATAAQDNVIRIWEAASGKPVRELPGHTATISSLKFSPDSTRLVSGSADKTIRVWDVASGKVFAQAESPHAITAVAWLLGGKQLASAGGDALLRFWTVPAQADAVFAPPKEISGHTQAVTSLDASSDGKQLLSGSLDGSVRQWAAESGKPVRQMDHGAPVLAVAIASNGKIFASAGGNSARLWNAEKGQPIGEMKGDHRVRLRISQSEQTLTFAKSEAAYWKTTAEAATKAQGARAEAARKAAEAMAAAEKGVTEKNAALAATTDDKTKAAAVDALTKAEAALATARAARQSAQLASKQAHQTIIDTTAALDKATTTQQQAEAEADAAKKALADSEKPVRMVAFAPDSLTVATAGDDEMIRTWSAENGAGFDTYPGHLGAVQLLTYTADARLVSGAAQKGAVVWRTKPGWTLARTIGTGDEKSPLVNRVLGLDFSADGKLLATGGGVPSRSGEVKIWRPADGTLVREVVPSHSDTVFSLDFSPDGKALATASADKFVKIFDTESGKLIKALSGHTHYVLGVSWKADGRALVSSGADQAVKLWTFPAGEQTKTVLGFNKEVTAARFVGLGGEILTASGEARVRLLKEDGTTARDFGGSKGFIFSAAITPDGQFVLGGGQDSVLRIWNAASGKNLFSLDPPPPESAAKK